MEKEKPNALSLINELSEAVITKDLIASEDFSKKYECLLGLIKRLDDVKKVVDSEIKTVTKDNYLDSGDSSITSGSFRYTYVPATTRETFDSKKLKSDDPDLYKKYVKVGNVSESFKVTAIKKKESDSKSVVIEAE